MITSVTTDAPLVLEYANRKAWTLHQHMMYTAHGAAGEVEFRLTVPAGFSCDLASIPWIARCLFPKYHRKYIYAALLHDWLYSNWKFCNQLAAAYEMNGREFADKLFHMAIWPTWRRDFLYLGVRWFGGRHYGRGEA